MQDSWRPHLERRESGGALMARQYLACAFKEGSRPYTYHNDGEPLAVGDLVRVAGRSGSEQRVRVAALIDEPPSFETKPIIGLAEPELEPEQQLFTKEQ